jgi:hypothetical protein
MEYDLDVKFKNTTDEVEFESGMNLETLKFLQESLNFR